MLNFEAHTTEERTEMLTSVGCKSLDDLYQAIPQDIKSNGLDLSDPLSEMEVTQEIKKMAASNKTDYACFLGGGASKRFIPAAVGQISSMFEFNTAYTPYQAEISQGTLQSIYEYQSMICNLTQSDVSNASMYDAATACAEAVLMSARINGKNKCVISEKLNPEYINVIKTYCEAADIDICFDITKVDTETACVVIQTPNFYGEIEDTTFIQEKIKDTKTLFVCVCDLISLSVLEPEDCDIVVGDLQPVGNTLSFGGPYGGFMACKDKYKRQLPGRIVGRTVDKNGNQAFCLTLQTREQHIRREKATSNICSNQALVALQTTVYLSLLGNTGLKQVALLSVNKAHMLAQKLQEKGFEVLSKDFFNEFVLKVNDANEFLSNLKENKILGGIKLDEHRVLVCVTEMNTQEEIDNYEYFAV